MEVVCTDKTGRTYKRMGMKENCSNITKGEKKGKNEQKQLRQIHLKHKIKYNKKNGNAQKNQYLLNAVKWEFKFFVYNVMKMFFKECTDKPILIIRIYCIEQRNRQPQKDKIPFVSEAFQKKQDYRCQNYYIFIKNKQLGPSSFYYNC